MRGIDGLLLAAVVTAAAVMSGPTMAEEAVFTRKGASLATQQRDSARCWQLAQKARLTDEQATQNVVTAYLVGGVIGVLIASSANDEANKDPKSAFRREVHDDCMAKRGYTKAE
jgi:hypothetical protein